VVAAFCPEPPVFWEVDGEAAIEGEKSGAASCADREIQNIPEIATIRTRLHQCARRLIR
jgi:hypothetical protein